MTAGGIGGEGWGCVRCFIWRGMVGGYTTYYGQGGICYSGVGKLSGKGCENGGVLSWYLSVLEA